MIDETIPLSFHVFLFLRILKRFQKGRPPAVFVFVQSRALAWRQRGKNLSNLYVCHCIFVFVCAYLYLCICICISCIFVIVQNLKHSLGDKEVRIRAIWASYVDGTERSQSPLGFPYKIAGGKSNLCWKSLESTDCQIYASHINGFGTVQIYPSIIHIDPNFS